MPYVSKLVPEETVFFLCDVQTRFSTLRSASTVNRGNWLSPENHIFGFDEVVLTVNKMLKIAKVTTTTIISYCVFIVALTIQQPGIGNPCGRHGTEPQRWAFLPVPFEMKSPKWQSPRKHHPRDRLIFSRTPSCRYHQQESLLHVNTGSEGPTPRTHTNKICGSIWHRGQFTLQPLASCSSSIVTSLHLVTGLRLTICSRSHRSGIQRPHHSRWCL
jgi:hypothetical protein